MIPEERPGIDRAPLAVLLLASTLAVMAGAIVAPVLQVIRDDLDIGSTAAGLILTTHGITIAVTSPLVGWLIDRYGVRRVLGIGLLIYGVAGGAGLLVSSYPVLIATRVVFGLGASAVFSGTTVALLGMYEGAARDRAMGWRTTATTMGGVVWPLIGGALGILSWNAPFGLYTVGLPLGLAALAVLPDARSADRSGAGRVLPLLRERPVLPAIYGLFFMMAFILYALAVFMPQRLAELGIESPMLVSMFQVALSIAASIVGMRYARLRATVNDTTLLRLSFLLSALALAVFALANSAPMLLIAPPLFGLGLGIGNPTLTVLIGEHVPEELRGRATALSGTTLFLGQFASPLLLGPLIDATSITTGFVVLTLVNVLVLAALLTTRIPAAPAPPARQPRRLVSA